MAAYADKTQDRQSQAATAEAGARIGTSGTHTGFKDNRPEAAVQRRLQETVDGSGQMARLETATRLMQPKPARAMPAQLVLITGPAGADIDVTEVPDGVVPVCLDSIEGTVKFYRRSAGITEGWNDTDLFYTKDGGNLVQVTTAFVNGYWDPKYDGFAQIGGPDWTKNCHDYAKAAGFGAKIDDFDGADALRGLIADNGHYVLKLSYHWMRVQRTGADAVTIRQKDGESAIYEKAFNTSGALEHITGKSSTGIVYRGA